MLLVFIAMRCPIRIIYVATAGLSIVQILVHEAWAPATVNTLDGCFLVHGQQLGASYERYGSVKLPLVLASFPSDQETKKHRRYLIEVMFR